MTDEALAHCKYSLRFVQDLLLSQTLQDVQALALITLQLRGFPKPGATWFCGQMALNVAIECGLHRSAESWSVVEQRKMDSHEVEKRKRVFWVLYGMVGSLSGRLGRPLPLRLNDVDIEFPSPVHDNLPEETNLSEFRKCSFQVGISVIRMFALFTELYSTFYTVSGFPSSDYESLVAKFRADLASWRSNVPPELSDASRAESEMQMYTLYLDLFEAEFLFLLHHPLICPPNQPEQYKQNLKHCLESISKTISVLVKIRDAKCLDVPWYNVTVLLAMNFTHLFAEDQRQDEISEVELQQLQSEMAEWLSIFGDVGTMLGMIFCIVLRSG